LELVKSEEANSSLRDALTKYKSQESAGTLIQDSYRRERERLEETRSMVSEQLAELERQTAKLASTKSWIEKEKHKIQTLRTQSEAEINEFWARCWEEQSKGFPTLAKKEAEAWFGMWRGEIDYLRARAPMTAIDLKQKLNGEIKALKQSESIFRNLVDYYETLFPSLTEYRDEISSPSVNPEPDPMLDGRRLWITDQEWQTLAEVERSQLALDRYCLRNKSKWEIGIEFERFCGHALEAKQWEVTYHGAIQGINDLGRDLIARKPGKILVVQCKRWSKEKTIHEKHIFQTYGTMVALRIDEPGTDVQGWFVTSTNLSDRARQFADVLGVKITENQEPGDFPRIKCNAKSKQGDVYHLPFDQQYDRIIMRPQKGDFYCLTAAEAENRGFRRAMRWFES
jgi:hypothetical protein